jgi:hypothetical protein
MQRARRNREMQLRDAIAKRIRPNVVSKRVLPLLGVLVGTFH